jgi:hypothetical protein
VTALAEKIEGTITPVTFRESSAAVSVRRSSRSASKKCSYADSSSGNDESDVDSADGIVLTSVPQVGAAVAPSESDESSSNARTPRVKRKKSEGTGSSSSNVKKRKRANSIPDHADSSALELSPANDSDVFRLDTSSSDEFELTASPSRRSSRHRARKISSYAEEGTEESLDSL